MSLFRGDASLFPCYRDARGSTHSFGTLKSAYVMLDRGLCGTVEERGKMVAGEDVRKYKLTASQKTSIRKAFERGELKKVIATGTWSEGVDFRQLSYLIRADGGSSEIDNTQIPGRLARLYPGKTVAYLIDFVDNFNAFARWRSLKRMKEYVGKKWLDRIMS